MHEHFYALYVFTVQSNGRVETTPSPLLVDFEDLTYPRGRCFASKLTQRMPGQLLKTFCVTIERFRVSGKKKPLLGDYNHPLPFVRQRLNACSDSPKNRDLRGLARISSHIGPTLSGKKLDNG